MGSRKAYPLRIPEGILKLAEIKSQEDRMDKATALRQWIYAGAEQYVLHLLSDGRLSISYTAELLEISIHDIYRLAKKYGIELGSTGEELTERSKSTLRLF